MMRAAALFLSAALAACGQNAAPPPAEPAAVQAVEAPAPAGEPMSTGLMGGMSETMPDEIAALTMNADSLAFTNLQEETVSVATTFLGVVEPSVLSAEGGQSFAAATSSSTATRVELRRFTGVAPQALCNGAAPTHAAIVSSEPLTGAYLMLFTGADAPGPAARDSAVCATYVYAVD